jgi:hypothetical protein
MGTALLSDGFYGFDLHGNLSVPRWYDEYSVDGNGTAVEDRSKKGYLGQALTGAVELTDGGTLIFQENFDASTVPSSFSQFPLGAVSVSNGSLVISNPDHTKNATVSANTNPTFVRLSAAKRYLLTFDFRILETLDSPQHGFQVGVFDSNNQSLDTYSGSEVAAGDSGLHIFLLQLRSMLRGQFGSPSQVVGGRSPSTTCGSTKAVWVPGGGILRTVSPW